MLQEKRINIQDCLFLVGPTASGKTALGIRLAQRLGAEIISLDSMAVYRGMDIGTAKPSAADRAAVPHHLIDILDPWEEYSVARYLDDAEQAIAAIRARGGTPLFVGGTPLYLKAVLRGLFEGPPANWEFRRQVQAWLCDHGCQALHERLQAVDPAAAERIHPRDVRRVIRALEVFELTGQPLSTWQHQFERPNETARGRVLVLDWPRDVLYQRINARVEAMFAAGLVEEVRRLLESGRQLSHTASQALGYREVLEYLAGQRTLQETRELVKTRTRQFAKRQLTWFRHLEECQFISICPPLDPEELAEKILSQFWPANTQP